MYKETNIFLIIDSKLIEQTKVKPYLTWVQKLVCKWFKIVPEHFFNYTYSLNIQDKGKVRVGDVLREFENKNLWRVIEITNKTPYNQTLIIKNVYEMHAYHNTKIIGNQIMLLYSQFKEGN